MLIIRKKIDIPMIGTWKWNEEDYDVPLIFDLSGVTAYLYLNSFGAGQRDRLPVLGATIEFHYKKPPKRILNALQTSGKQSVELAEKIYEYYLEVFNQFEAILRTVGGIRNLMPEAPISFERFFERKGVLNGGVVWQVDGFAPKEFYPKVQKRHRGINPLFKRDQIIDTNKWARLQKALDDKNFPTEEIMELLRIRSKLEFRDRRVAIIEAAILIETVLREYATNALLSLGLNKNKFKDLKNELSFNSMLNIIIPITLPKAEAKRMQRHIQAVDSLRKARNDIVHGNKTGEELDDKQIKNGVDGALKLVDVLKSRTKSLKA